MLVAKVEGKSNSSAAEELASWVAKYQFKLMRLIHNGTPVARKRARSRNSESLVVVHWLFFLVTQLKID